MNKNANRPDQTSGLLRLLAGGYLVNLAWDLRTSIGESPLFLIAVAVFALAGAALVLHSLRVLMRQSRSCDPAIPETEEGEERSED